MRLLETACKNKCTLLLCQNKYSFVLFHKCFTLWQTPHKIWLCWCMYCTCPADQDKPCKGCPYKRAVMTSFLIHFSPAVPMLWTTGPKMSGLEGSDGSPVLPGWTLWCLFFDSIHWYWRLELDSSPHSKISDTSTIKLHGSMEEREGGQDPVFGCTHHYGFQSTSGWKKSATAANSKSYEVERMMAITTGKT